MSWLRRWLEERARRLGVLSQGEEDLARDVTVAALEEVGKRIHRNSIEHRDSGKRPHSELFSLGETRARITVDEFADEEVKL